MLIERHARALIVEALNYSRVVLVLGARQVGKSTLAKQVATNDHPATVVTLDDQATRDAARRDPHGFIGGLRGPVLIDEVQLVPDLLYAIKQTVDEDLTPGRFLLTGSANVLTAPRISESLAGRVRMIELWPLAQSEIHASCSRTQRAPASGVVSRLRSRNRAARPARHRLGPKVGRDAHIAAAARHKLRQAFGLPQASSRSTALRQDRQCLRRAAADRVPASRCSGLAPWPTLAGASHTQGVFHRHGIACPAARCQ